MAYIKVDHSKFSSASKAIDAYVKSAKSKMKSASGEVDNLAANWEGADFTQFKIQWNRTDDKDSVYATMIKSLVSYSDFLKYASKEYKNAQARAVNRANNLPRW